MKQNTSQHENCFAINLIAMAILIASLVPWQSVYSQDSIFWNQEMIKIAKPSSKQGWIDLKEELNVNPKTIFNEYKLAFGIKEGTEMKVAKISPDLTGNKHYRYKQYYKGLQVEGGEYIIHEKRGIAVGANGRLMDKLPFDATPLITEQNALKQVLRYLNASEYYWQNVKRERFLKTKTKDTNATYYPKGELLFAYIDLEGEEKPKNVLAYKFTIRTSKPKDESWAIYVDAKTNTIIKNVSLDQKCSPTSIQTNFNGVQQIGTYTDSFTSGFDLEDDCSPTTIKVYDINNDNNIFNDADNNWTNPYDLSAASSLWAIKRSLDVYGVYFNRSGWDGDDGSIDIYQGWNFGNNNNAEFRSDGEVHIGLGSTNSVNDDYNTLDILGHEFSHGVSGTETKWGGKGSETGSLNEAFSDIMGETIEFYVTGGADWVFGGNRGATRSLSDPKSFSNPDTYLGKFWNFTSSDNYGVHTNCGPMNYAFFLLSQGNSGWNDGNTSHAPAGSGYSYNVSGIGIINASRIFYNALFYLNSTAQYNDMRNATLSAAIAMYGSDCANEVVQLAEAWRAVGVGTQSAFFNNKVCSPLTSNYYKGSGTVTAGGNCSIVISGIFPVQFEARDAVLLLPGFTAKAGSDFRANINPCVVTTF